MCMYETHHVDLVASSEGVFLDRLRTQDRMYIKTWGPGDLPFSEY